MRQEEEVSRRVGVSGERTRPRVRRDAEHHTRDAASRVCSPDLRLEKLTGFHNFAQRDDELSGRTTLSVDSNYSPLSPVRSQCGHRFG
jgi:hypothetical protein